MTKKLVGRVTVHILVDAFEGIPESQIDGDKEVYVADAMSAFFSSGKAEGIVLDWGYASDADGGGARDAVFEIDTSTYEEGDYLCGAPKLELQASLRSCCHICFTHKFGRRRLATHLVPELTDEDAPVTWRPVCGEHYDRWLDEPGDPDPPSIRLPIPQQRRA